MQRPRVVIVGASLAGATAAVTLREEGFDGEIRLIGAEAQLPYNRPPLSKGYLRGEDTFEGQLIKPAEVLRRAAHHAQAGDAGDGDRRQAEGRASSRAASA